MTSPDRPIFPIDLLPESAADQKLLGLYPQRQEGLMLQRVRILGGRLSPAQLTALAEAARKARARDALHLTTRQDIEIHGLSREAVPGLQASVARAGLTTVGSAGDTVRNSTVDPLGGLVDGNVDLLPLASAIEEALLGLEGVWSLPRKFKLSFSGDGCGSMRPWMSDVGVIAAADDAFTAIVAGSLGARPVSGLPFPQALSAEDVAALAVAAVRLHAEEGDREDRRKARLRHVRERLGNDLFLARLGSLFAEELQVRRTRMPRPIPSSRGACSTHVRLAVPHGDLPLRSATRLARAVELAGGEIRLGIEHDLHVFGLEPPQLPAEVSGWVSPRRLVACPGMALCSKAAGPTREAAEVLQTIAETRPDLLFALSGCPNSCSHAAAAGVGVVSRMRRSGETREPVFRLTVGGQAGAGPVLGVLAITDVPLADLAETVERILAEKAGGREVEAGG